MDRRLNRKGGILVSEQNKEVKPAATASTAAVTPPKPATPAAPPPRPAAPAAKPSPVPKQPLPKVQPQGRRNFLKFMATLGGILGITPFIPFGSFFTFGGGTGKSENQRILLQDGSFANVKTFPPDSAVIFPYPRTGDPRFDGEPFRRFQIIRLSKAEGGDKNDMSAFRVYSMVCVHLWCLWDYRPGREVKDPKTGRTIVGNIECPCHGSNYRVTDGVAIYGPAALQTPPNNALPMLDIEIDSEGFVSVKPPTYTADANGIVGYGRKVKA